MTLRTILEADAEVTVDDWGEALTLVDDSIAFTGQIIETQMGVDEQLDGTVYKQTATMIVKSSAAVVSSLKHRKHVSRDSDSMEWEILNIDSSYAVTRCAMQRAPRQSVGRI